MFIVKFDINNFIPTTLQQKAKDELVNFVTEQMKRYVSDKAAEFIKKLHTDAVFQSEFKKGLQKASRRFVNEYILEDEDLVEEIAKDSSIFEDEEVQEALLTIIRNPGRYLASQQALIEQSFDNILPHRRNRDRVNRAITFFLKCLAEEVWNLPELRPIYELQFQRVTAESVHEQLAVQKAQLQILTGLDMSIRETLYELTTKLAEKKLLASQNATVSTTRHFKHNLPQPTYGHFIGRQTELAQVVRLLRPYPYSQEHLITIDGIGGIGKSTLAIEVAYRYIRNYDRIPKGEHFDAIVWTSAKQTVLTSEGIIPRYHTSKTLDDVYAAIAAVFERQDIIRIRQEERASVVHNALSRQRTLIIVDNLETIDDELVINFLRELPAPTKAIVTTRHRLDVAYPVRVKAMPVDDSIKLISQECEKKRVELKAEEASHLYKRTGGVPLAIVWSIGQINFGYSTKTVLTRLGHPNNDIIKFCFEESLTHIKDKPAYKILQSLSFFATDASRTALGYIASLPELDVDDGLVDLEKLSLITRNQSARFEISPLTTQLAISKLDAQTTKFFEKQYVSYYQRLANEVTNSNYWGAVRNYQDLKAISKEMSNITRAIELSVDLASWRAIIDLCYVSVHYYAFSGELASRLFVVEKAIKAAEEINDNEALSWLLVDALGWIYLSQGDIPSSKHNVLRGKRLAERANNLNCISLANGYLARIEAGEENFERANKLIQTAIDLTTSPFIVARIHLIGGYIASKNNNYQKAIYHYEEVLKVTPTTNDIFEELQARISLGYSHLYSKNHNASEQAFLTALERSIFEDLIIRVAESKRGLAALYSEIGEEEKSQQFMEEANAIFDTLDVYVEVGF